MCLAGCPCACCHNKSPFSLSLTLKIINHLNINYNNDDNHSISSLQCHTISTFHQINLLSNKKIYFYQSINHCVHELIVLINNLTCRNAIFKKQKNIISNLFFACKVSLSVSLQFYRILN